MAGIISLFTNLSDREIPKDFRRDFTRLIGKTLNQEQARWRLILRNNNTLFVRESSTSPRKAAVLQIWSPDGTFVDLEVNKKYTNTIMDYLNTTLELEDDKIMLIYSNVKGEEICRKYADI